jgi:hypothetical protein
MMTRRSFLAAAPAAAFAQKESMEQRGKRVVEEALAALGGEKFLGMKDRVEAGRAYSFYNARLTGLSRAKIYTRYLVRPEPPQAGFFGVRERQSFGRKDKEESYVLFQEDGKAYDVTYRGAKEMADATYARYKDTTLRNVFYILRMRLGEPGLIVEGKGGDVVDYSPVEIVDFTDSDNRVVTVYFHRTTKLPVKQRFSRMNPQREQDEETTLYGNYRNVAGVMWPNTIERQRNGDKIFQIYSDTVTIDSGLPDTLFSLPPGTPDLGKEK